MTTTELNCIPAMVHELGRHWQQPADIREAPMDDKYIMLTRRQFDELNDYSASMPSGVYEGKCWKAQWNSRLAEEKWFMRWYAPCEDPNQMEIPFRWIIVVED